jgi:hypothetical protein
MPNLLFLNHTSKPNFQAKKIPAVLGYEIKQDHEEVTVYSGEVLQ